MTWGEVVFAALLAAAPAAAGNLAYAGGPYPITLVQIAVDGAGNTYAIGNWNVAYSTSGAVLTDVVVSKFDPYGNMVYRTYVGGKGSDMARGIAVDSAGNVYGVGVTTSIDFPLMHAVQATKGSAPAGFVFRLDAGGNLSWSTYFGGAWSQMFGSSVEAVAADSAGNAYITGFSSSADMIVTPGAFQTVAYVSEVFPEPHGAAFVAKFSPAGTLVYSTWLGGGWPACNEGLACEDDVGQGVGSAIAVDAGGNAFVAGYTNADNFPTTGGAYQAACDCDAVPALTSPFVAKLNAAGSALLYSTYAGSNVGENIVLAVDGTGDAYIAGITANSPSHAFLEILNPSGSALVSPIYSFSASSLTTPAGIAIEPAGNILLVGNAASGSGTAVETDHAGATILNSLTFPAGLANGGAAVDPANGNLLVAGSSGYLMRLTALNAAALPPIEGVGNAANWTVDNAVSPNEIVSVYGNGIGPATPVTAQPVSGVYPNTLGGVQVLFNQAPAPLLYVSATQINAVVPVDFTNPATYSIEVTNNTTPVASLTLPVVANVPGLFRNADGTLAAVNQDGTLNTAQNPAPAGSVISLWGTGISALTPGIPGNVATTADNLAVNSGLQLESSGGSILYAGPAPGEIDSVFQINLQLPQTFPVQTTAQYPLRISAGSVSSPYVSVWVLP
jgi:uncharacterized protein (TIGR03437 family)